jgi:F-type H+-transporting ATPase subunit delta
MSRELTVGKRYAKALFELAKEKEQLELVEQELQGVVLMFADASTSDFFQHPSIGIEQKLDVLNKALSGKVSETVLDTLKLMIQRRREAVLGTVASHYSRLFDEYRGRATAIVYTPMPINDEESSKLSAYYGKVTGKEIRIQNVINKELLGGMQVRIGDRLYDASLASKLAGLKKILA